MNNSFNDTVNNFINEGKKIIEERINLADIPNGPNFALFMCSLAFGIFWITYITFFNSRIVGSILTKIANKFVTQGYVHIGSLSWSVLSGKVMFRDVYYITVDYTLRVQDGFLIFRWWRSYVPKTVYEDLSHSDTRLSIQLNGFEFHIYNRSSIYHSLEKKFGMHPERFGQQSSGKETLDDSYIAEFILGKNWRDLIPVIKIDISSGKIVFGNRLLPSTLVVSFEEMKATYSTKHAGSSLDHFMHFVKCKTENLKVLLAPSPKYSGQIDEAPRFMGEGFVVVSSNHVDFYYYMDEAGVVPSGSGDDEKSPEWGLDVKCGKGTDFSYGPWADRQRENLHKFFFPSDYQILDLTPKSKIGDRRVATHFLIRLSTQFDSTVDLLFSKQKETNAVHMNCGPGTNFDIRIPWSVSESGYVIGITGTLLMVEATTSLPFRDLLECETLQLNINLKYNRIWNARQEWDFELRPSKISAHFIFVHKWFFQDLLDDWSYSQNIPDLCYFVPYTWKFNFILSDFELLLPANEFNWIDTSSTNQENSYVSICGSQLKIEFELPNIEFLPKSIPFVFKIEGCNLDLTVFLPETNTSHDILRLLQKLSTDSVNKWRRLCKYEEGWIDCWWTPRLQLDIEFLYHPIYMSGLSLPPESLPCHFDLNTLEADRVTVNLQMSSSVAYLYGTLIRNFIHIKDNLFGVDQLFTPMDNTEGYKKTPELMELEPRFYRPLEVILNIRLVGDLKAHLMNGTQYPFLRTKNLVFEMKKNFRETKLQLLLGNVGLFSGLEDEYKGSCRLTALQFRGHAMFSEMDKPLGSDTSEYAWLIEIHCGSLCGKMSAPQFYEVYRALEIFIHLLVDKENVCKSPSLHKICIHNNRLKDCSLKQGENCFTESELKYKMTRFLLDSIDVHIIDKSSDLRIQLVPFRFSMCNLHGKTMKQGLTALIQQITLQLFVNSNFPLHSNNTTHQEDIWIECSSLFLGPIHVDSSFLDIRENESQESQMSFLNKCDQKTKRLSFLWPRQNNNICGCVGGCQFFGENSNGLHFFSPSLNDVERRINVGIPHTNSTSDFGFFQSLLQFQSCAIEDWEEICSLPEAWPLSCHTLPKVPASRSSSKRRKVKKILTNDNSLSSGEQGDINLLLRRTNSLVSDVYSFYSLDDDVGSKGISSNIDDSLVVSEDDDSIHSYVSALSETEELGLVNLHTQLAKPITESSILITSYISHLTQLRCSNWRGQESPKFESLSEGLGSMRMRSKDEEKERKTHTRNRDEKAETCNTTTTIILYFERTIDFFISPMALEYIQRILESLTPVVQNLSLLYIVNHLHGSSIESVESKNSLQKDSSFIDLDDKTELEENDETVGKMVQSFEKSLSSYTQVSIIVPKINIMVLQASVVEDVVAFSALDNVRDITCLSLLSLGLEETIIECCKRSLSKKTVQMFVQKQNEFLNESERKTKSKSKKYKILTDSRSKEPFTFESSEAQKEEFLLRSSCQKVHAQLRRLKNDSSILKDASITAIPNSESRVFFSHCNVPTLSSFPSEKEEEELGFNMCELGLEGLAIKVAKRSSNQEESPELITIENEINSPPLSQQGKHSTASGCIELKTVWFNFAAPPKTPISRKIDFTKLDWNLLSTASPSIDAWLTPLDRLQSIYSSFLHLYHQRVSAVLACLMAEALDVASNHFLKLTKYDKLTPLAKTLRDDPSCQLCSILLRYIRHQSLKDFEEYLDWKGLPPLLSLRHGIVVLSRQWKNALYTPILIEYNLRSKSLKNIFNAHLDTITESNDADDEEEEEQEENEEEEEEEDDDKALLLKHLGDKGSYESLLQSEDHRPEESLYDWMKRQTNDNSEETHKSTLESNTFSQHPSSVHLLDAHLIFEPLLSSLGLMPQQIQNVSLKNLVSDISILSTISEFSILIVESVLDRGKNDQKTSPAFLCQKMYLEIDFKKKSDISGKVLPLYMSTAQLKRHTSALMYFSLDIQCISQSVNMPLLRLLNQILTMHQNFQETNEELRIERGGEEPCDLRHKKSPSESSTNSNVSVPLRRMESIEMDVKSNNMTPSPLTTFRPKSLTHKFRPSSRFSNLDSPHQPDSFILPALLERITEEQVSIRCWKTMYNLLELYSTMPTTKTVQRQSSLTPHCSLETGSLYKGRRIKTPPDSSIKKEVSFAKTDQNTSPLIVFGIAKIRETHLTATLSGLKLEGEIKGLQSSFQYKEKLRQSIEISLVGNMSESRIILLEGPNQVVQIHINKSILLHSSLVSKRAKDRNLGTVSIDFIFVDIPQHPVDLHSIVTRGTKELSSTLQEFKSVRGVKKSTEETSSSSKKVPMTKLPEEKSNLLKPFVMQFQFILHRFVLSAALLPSLQAEYAMNNVTSRGMTGSKAKFSVHLPEQTLSCITKLTEGLESSLPSEVSVALPPILVSAEYIPSGSQMDGYLSAEAEIGELEHCLTTDLLNHLVFVQKVFMKEVNDVVQKMSGADRPVALWSEIGEEVQEMESHTKARLYFSILVRLKQLTITATTPAESALRLETGISELEFSNRIEGSSMTNVSTKANINLKLSLGQILRDPIYFEAENTFQQQAYFKTSIQLRNTFRDDVIHIVLARPFVFVQPLAIDRAILVWLSYKNAWEYWTEQRLNLNSEILMATEQVLEKVPLSQLRDAHIGGPLFLNLNVQNIGLCLPLNKTLSDECGALVLTVESSSMSACSSNAALTCQGNFKDLLFRFTEYFNHTLDDWKPDAGEEESSMNFCLVAEGSYDVCSTTTKGSKVENPKWLLNIKWQMTGVDVHVDTNIGKHLSSLGHTLTTMTGDEIYGDNKDDEHENINEDNGENTNENKDENDGRITFSSFTLEERRHRLHRGDDLPEFLFDSQLSNSDVAKFLEKEINEQAKTVKDLQQLGASEPTISLEIKKLEELQNIASKNFRLNLAQRLRRQRSTEEEKRRKLTRKSKSVNIFLPEMKDDDNCSDSENFPKNFHTTKTNEPLIDFELDVKIFIHRGKCVLHTNREEWKTSKRPISNLSPNPPPRKHRNHGMSSYSSSRIFRETRPLDLITIFHIPGLDVRLQYTSKMEENRKKGILSSWLTLQSIPEETIITPNILDFLERALEPIPIHLNSKSSEAQENENLSSFPVDVIVYFHIQSSTFRFSCHPISRVECMLQLPSLNLVFSSKKSEDEGGLSVTGCLNDFNLYIFHPYGGGRKKKPEEMNFSPLSSEERKDSLLVHVAFVKFHISRSRKIHCKEAASAIATVRFSSIIEIGSATFQYDMRRLTEILAFPKAWYRRTLVRRLFLGELKSSSNPESPSNLQYRQKKSSGWIRGKSSFTDWETLVMFAIHFKELKVHMNMGNVMGNVDWNSKDFRAEGRLSIGSMGHKNMFIGLCLKGSRLEAKGGIVGGFINLGKIHTYVTLKEDKGLEPFHKVGLQLDVIESTFEYMGTSVLMGRVSYLSIEVNDDWHITHEVEERGESGGSTERKPAQIFVQGNLSWDQLQILLSKSTTADLIKIYHKLEEFFLQQFRSSKKLFYSLEPGTFSSKQVKKQSRRDTKSKVNHHRHWQRALKKIGGIKIATLSFDLPTIGSVLGGVFYLHGNHISLACFQGINFKSKSWALFSLKDPSISFVSDAQELLDTKVVSTTATKGDGDTKDQGKDDVKEKREIKTTNVIQTFSLSLGSLQSRSTDHDYMATVKKISRSVNYLPPIKACTDWFTYALKSSELDEVYRFPSISSMDKEIKVTQKTEEIFALPCLRLDLKTKHIQSNSKFWKEEPKPVIDCTFVTDFDNHICVTTDAEAFFFLHDLITSYVKEKDRVLSMQSNGNDVVVDPLQNDWRQFECQTWHLEPTLQFKSWACSELELNTVDLILQHLGFSHARTTIPKWIQRGCMDPMDKILSLLVLKTIQLVREKKDPGVEKEEEENGENNVDENDYDEDNDKL